MTWQSGGGGGASYPGVTSDNANGLAVAGKVTAPWRGLAFTSDAIVLPSNGTTIGFPVHGILHQSGNDLSTTADDPTITVDTPGWYRVTVAADPQTACEAGANYNLADDNTVSVQSSPPIGARQEAPSVPSAFNMERVAYYQFDGVSKTLWLGMWQGGGTLPQTFAGIIVIEYLGPDS